MMNGSPSTFLSYRSNTVWPVPGNGAQTLAGRATRIRPVVQPRASRALQALPLLRVGALQPVVLCHIVDGLAARVGFKLSRGGTHHTQHLLRGLCATLTCEKCICHSDHKARPRREQIAPPPSAPQPPMLS